MHAAETTPIAEPLPAKDKTCAFADSPVIFAREKTAREKPWKLPLRNNL
jgi:hypothetical protein